MFSGPVEVLSVRAGFENIVTEDLGDEIWVIGHRWNGSVAARSLDDGQTWTEVSFGPPPDSGTTHVQHVVRGDEGRYVAIAARESSCLDGETKEGGFIRYYVCQRERPVVFVSDDKGETWSESAPTGLAPPSGASLHINDLITYDGGYLAAGTIEGPGWRAVLFTSPDGVSWTAEREFVGDDNPMTAQTIAYDGANLVFTAHETPCDNLNDNTGGWVLGAGWARHGRIFIGSDIGSLTLQQPGEHPLAVAPLDIPPDCAPIDDIPVSFYPYPEFTAEVIAGTLTVVERHVPLEQITALEEAEESGDDELIDELESTLGTRRWAQLVDGEWIETNVVGVNVLGGSTQTSRSFYVAAAHRPAFVEVRNIDSPLHEVFTVTEDEPAQVRSAAPIPISRVMGAIGVDDGYLLFGLQTIDPFKTYQLEDPASIVAWHTTAGEGSPVGRCDLEPGGQCRFADLTEYPGYPDFSGRDLAGVDLTGTEIGAADFSGADLSGARLWLVTSDRREPPSFVGANLTDAQLQRAELGDISDATVGGATFADANIRWANGVDFSDAVMFEVEIEDLTGVTFGDADLSGARLDITETLPDLERLNYQTIEIAVSFSAEGPFEFDMSGLDLTGVSFRGPLGGDDLAVITSLDGAVLDNTRFSYVDLSGIDPSIDLSEVLMGSEVICPDGQPSEGLPGTCVRDG